MTLFFNPLTNRILYSKQKTFVQNNKKQKSLNQQEMLKIIIDSERNLDIEQLDLLNVKKYFTDIYHEDSIKRMSPDRPRELRNQSIRPLFTISKLCLKE